MQAVEIPFGELLPDQPTYRNPGLIKAQNTYPVPGGYGPFAGPMNTSVSVSDDVVRGASRLVDNGGDYVFVAGTTGGDLVVVQASTPSITTKSPLGAGQAWNFAQFNNFAVAVAKGHAPQYLTNISSDTVWSDLPGSPPQGGVVGRLGDFLVIGDTTTATPNRVEWSAFNDPTTWGVDPLKQMGGFNFPQEYGAVTAIVNEPFPCVFQQRAVWSFNPSGGASVFQRIPAARGIGAMAGGSVISRGQEMAFLSRDGFYVTDGAGITQIGSSRVNRWFLRNVSQSRIGEVHGVVDWTNECYVWAFPTGNTTDFDRLIIYSYAQQRWATAVTNVQYLTEGALLGLTDADLDSIYGDLDSVPYNVDDEIFTTRGDVLAAWVDDDGDSTLATFSATPLRADFETGDFQPIKGKRSFVTGLRPLVENMNQSTTAAVIEKSPVPGAPRSLTPFSAQELDGFCPQLVEGAFMGAAVRVPAGASWGRANGVQIRADEAGEA